MAGEIAQGLRIHITLCRASMLGRSQPLINPTPRDLTPFGISIYSLKDVEKTKS